VFPPSISVKQLPLFSSDAGLAGASQSWKADTNLSRVEFVSQR
jgi:hypothetical protein